MRKKEKLTSVEFLCAYLGVVGVAYVATLQRKAYLFENWHVMARKSIYDQLTEPESVDRYRERLGKTPPKILLSQYQISFPKAYGDNPAGSRYLSSTCLGCSRAKQGESTHYFEYFLTAGHVRNLFDQKEPVDIVDVKGNHVKCGVVDGFTYKGDTGIMRVDIGDRNNDPLNSVRELISPGKDLSELVPLGALGYIHLGYKDGVEKRLIWQSEIVRVGSPELVEASVGEISAVWGVGKDAHSMDGMSGGLVYSYEGEAVGTISGSRVELTDMLIADPAGIWIMPISDSFPQMFEEFLVGELV